MSSEPLVIEGPFAFEICAFRYRDLGLQVLQGLFSGADFSQHDQDLVRLTVQLVDRMQNRRLPKMLCLLCDHEFDHDEPPCEVSLAIPWASREQPALCQAICEDCAALDRNIKRDRMLAIWQRLSPGVSFLSMPGEA